MAHIGTETAFGAAARARALQASGRDIIHLHLGEPDFDTPPNIIEAATRALADGLTHYAPPARRARLPGGRGGRLHGAARRRGDPRPGRHHARRQAGHGLRACWRSPDPATRSSCPTRAFPSTSRWPASWAPRRCPSRLRAEQRVPLDLDELRSLVTPRTRLLVFNSPQNPTGARALALRSRGHRRHRHGSRPRSSWPTRSTRASSTTASTSRSSAIDGHGGAHDRPRRPLQDLCHDRLAPGLGHPAASRSCRVFERLLINTVSCTATYAQIAGAEALTGPQDAVDAMVAEFRARRAPHRRRPRTPCRASRRHARPARSTPSPT